MQHDPVADRQLLKQIARWCERYTPLVALNGCEDLMLDITGCTHLFDGEEGLLADMTARLNAQGFDVSIAIADTAGAAWALSRYNKARIAPPDGHRELLEPMPLVALRLSREETRELDRLGLKTVGCLLNLPRAPIVARFGKEVAQRLDQALGHEDEVLNPLRPVSELVAEKRFPDPIVYEDDIKQTIALLASNLSQSLEKKGLGMRECELVLFRADGEVVSLTVAASTAMRDAKRMAALFDERLASLHDEWDAGFGFDVLRLNILRAEKLDASQRDMMRQGEADNDIGHLIDRLSARLGAGRVQVYQMADTHIPERRFNMAPAIHSGKRGSLAVEILPETMTRPLVLLQRPELAEAIAEVPEGPPIRFRWRKVHYRVLRSEGPERIACEWWKDGRSAYSRDYFRIETQDGYRLWIFRHGLYERETASPNWYVHGLFG